MQSGIKNATEEFIVLGNVQALKSGALNPEVLKMQLEIIWFLETRKRWQMVV